MIGRWLSIGDCATTLSVARKCSDSAASICWAFGRADFTATTAGIDCKAAFDGAGAGDSDGFSATDASSIGSTSLERRPVGVNPETRRAANTGDGLALM